jgi:hypothetical protein
MALSGSFFNKIAGGYTLRVYWSVAQSIGNNTSTPSVDIYLDQDSTYSLNVNTRADNMVTVAGKTYTWASPSINNTGGRSTRIARLTLDPIAHDSDGTKSVTMSVKYNIRATISGTYYESITASATLTFDQIKRATQPTVSSTSVFMGSAVTISTPRASSSFTHDLAYAFAGSAYTAIATSVGTSYSWTVPDLASRIPNSTSGVVTIRCITKSGSTTVGTKTITLTAKVPASVVPTISAVNLTEVTSGLAAQFKAFIQGKSAVKCTITAAGAKGSTIKSYSSTFQGRAYSGNSWTSGILGTAGSLSLVTTVTDSRGRTAKKTTTVTVLDYSPPLVSAFRVYRCNASGTPMDNGTAFAAAYAYSVPTLNGGNTAKAVLSYKRTTASTYTQAYSWTALSQNRTQVVTSATFSVDYQYDIKLEVTDWFGGAPTALTAILPSGAVILDILANGKGLAFGKTADKEGVDFGWSPKGAVLGLGEVSQFIPSNGDFNNYVTPGVYGVQTSEIAKTLDNGPDTVYAGTLRVWNATGEGRQTGAWVYIMQEYRPFYASEPTFRRLCNADASGKWSYPTSWETIGGLRNYTVTWGSDVTNKGYSLSREGGMVCFNAHVSVRADIAAGATKVIGTLPDEVLLTNTILSMGRHGTSAPISVALRPSGELVVTPTSNYSSTASIFFTLTWNTAATWN